MCQSCRLQDMGVREKFMCHKHGLRHIQFKCDFCCNVAQLRCHANTYFCEECHENPTRLNKQNCGGNANKCKFGITHHPTKKGVPIAGCILCKSEMQVSNPISITDKQDMRLKKVLKQTDMQLKKIILAKKASARHIRSATLSSYSSQRSIVSAQSSTSSESSFFSGRRVF